MTRILAIGITLAITSFFYFPFWFTAFPEANTKLIMAVVGLVILGVQSAKGKTGDLDKKLLILSLFAVIFSLICFFSVTFNGTQDYAYATYIASMWVWLSGAYTICQLIKAVHGLVSFPIVSHYLVGVCVIQCFLALFIDMNPTFKSFIDAHIQQDQEFLTEVKRLYGIGAMLDTAGVRFSIALLLLSYLMTTKEGGNWKRLTLYISAFIILTTIGNMIARTTLIGVILGLFFIAYRQFIGNGNKPFTNKELLISLFIVVFIFVPIIVYFYQTNNAIHKNLRFGFEGFFNLFENGKWSVGSNETLKSMIVFPSSLKTWVIGDGYFANPVATDPYFTGEVIGGYYMGTDIGYLRFIFYCGVTGLIAFSLFIVRATTLCIIRFPEKKFVLILLLVLNFIVWLKVSTDIFLIFALLLMADSDKDVENKKSIPITE